MTGKYSSLFNRSHGLAAMGMVSLLLLASCTKDNVHQPQPDTVPENKSFKGTLSSAIPDFPFFEPVVTDNTLQINWENLSATRATLVLNPFELYVENMNLQFTIGEMNIENVLFVYNEDDGTAAVSCPHFECQAGNYYSIGSLEGLYTPSTSSIEFTITYKPGSMPFNVKSTFISQ